MNILNWNIRGLNAPRNILRDLLIEHKVSIVALHETKKKMILVLEFLSLFLLKLINEFGYISLVDQVASRLVVTKITFKYLILD